MFIAYDDERIIHIPIYQSCIDESHIALFSINCFVMRESSESPLTVSPEKISVRTRDEICQSLELLGIKDANIFEKKVKILINIFSFPIEVYQFIWLMLKTNLYLLNFRSYLFT